MWSYAAFLAEGALLVARSQRLLGRQQDGEDGENNVAEWQWRHGKRPHLPGNSYLVSHSNARTHIRKDQAKSSKNAGTDVRSVSEWDDINTLLEDDDDKLSDPAAASQCEATRGEDGDTLLYDFHIVFHAVYQAPVLYFRVTRLDGSPVSFHNSDAMTDLRLPGSNDRTALVSMEDHQVLGTPFYFLHPCETASAMELLLSQPSANSSSSPQSSTGAITSSNSDCESEVGEPTYLLAWLSLVQPLTRIDPRVY